MKLLEYLNGKTIAITGASGYIGSAIADALTKHSGSILRISRKELTPKTGMRTVQADIRKFECWLDIVRQADVIFHLAGNTSVYAAAKDPAESLNATLLPINHLVHAASELRRGPRVVFSSTATVYGLTNELPVAETLAPCPITVYDLHKLFAEQQLALATHQGVLEGVSLRLANVYGPSSSASSADDRGVLNRITAMALEQRNLKIYGDGNHLRDYVYIDDVVDAFLLAGVAPKLGGMAFNVATGTGTTLRRAFELVVDQTALATGKRIDTEFHPWPSDADPIEFRHFVASIASFSAATGWWPKVNLDGGVRLLIADYLNRQGRRKAN